MQGDRTIVKKKYRRVVFLFVIFPIFLGVFLYLLVKRHPSSILQPSQYELVEYTSAFDKKTNIHLFIADTDRKRSQGLSIFDTLDEDQAMLFIFDEPGLYPFWMKGMNFAIDILWLDENGEVVFIKENAKPSDYPNAYYPDNDALYVIEFVSGFTQEKEISIGSNLSHILKQD